MGRFQIAIQLRQTKPQFKLIQTIGGRAISLQPKVAASANAANKLDDLEDGWRDKYSSLLPGAASNRSQLSPQFRLQQAITQLAQILAGEEAEYRERLVAWGDTDRSQEPPCRRESPLQTLLDLFSEVFPEITIAPINIQKTETYSQNRLTVNFSFSLACTKNGATYPINDMSDGEKQVFASLVDRYFLRDTQSIFVIDEPELNLDPQLACDFWNLMEREMPTSVFLYATHSLDFALRKNVHSIWTIGRSGPTELDRKQLLLLPVDEQRRFLGGIRGILSADIGVVVEGADDSIDSTFYKWLLEGIGQVCVRGYGGCEDVLDATRRLDIWQHIVPSAKIVGVIDRDYRSDAELASIHATGCVALDLHDAESYLCHPTVLRHLAEKLGIVEFPSDSDLAEQIRQFFQSTISATCARRMARRFHVRRHVSIPNDMLSEISTEAELLKAAMAYAQLDQNNPPVETSPTTVASVVREEFARCKNAVDNNDVDEMLRLARGKDLLDQFAKLFKFENGKAVVEYVALNLSPTSFPHLHALRDKILQQWTPIQPQPAPQAM